MLVPPFSPSPSVVYLSVLLLSVFFGVSSAVRYLLGPCHYSWLPLVASFCLYPLFPFTLSYFSLARLIILRVGSMLPDLLRFRFVVNPCLAPTCMWSTSDPLYALPASSFPPYTLPFPLILPYPFIINICWWWWSASLCRITHCSPPLSSPSPPVVLHYRW